MRGGGESSLKKHAREEEAIELVQSRERKKLVWRPSSSENSIATTPKREYQEIS